MMEDEELCIVNFNENCEENCFVDASLGHQGQSSFQIKKTEVFKKKSALGLAHINSSYLD